MRQGEVGFQGFAPSDASHWECWTPESSGKRGTTETGHRAPEWQCSRRVATQAYPSPEPIAGLVAVQVRRRTVAKKDDYQEKVEARLKELDAQIDVLRAKADKATAETKLESYTQLVPVNTKREVARVRLQTMAVVGEQAREDLKTGVVDALNDLERAVGKATSAVD